MQQQCNSCLGCSRAYSVSDSKQECCSNSATVVLVAVGHSATEQDVATIVQLLSWLQWDIQHHVLLTGTPIQNNLGELYALLAFVDGKQFKPSCLNSFVEKYTNSSKDCKFQKHTWRQIHIIYVCIHTSRHTYRVTRWHTHTCQHTYTFTHVGTCTHSHMSAPIHIRTCRHTCTFTHVGTCTHSHVSTHTFTHVGTHTCRHMYTFTHAGR